MIDVPPIWDPRQYSRFESERDRAAHDLLQRLPDDLNPRVIWDLGCGAGQHAVTLKGRYPEAVVQGLDSSAAMLEQARTRSTDIGWRQGDIVDWVPDRPVDLILANAALHWLPDHEGLLARLAATLAPGGVLAVQMPMAHETRHHVLMREVASREPWASRLAGIGTIAPLLTPEAYYDVLARSCSTVDIWSTTYLHVLIGPDAVLEWMKGTALRPCLTALDGTPMRSAFLSAFAAALLPAFPPRADGMTLLRFPRLFLLAQKR